MRRRACRCATGGWRSASPAPSSATAAFPERDRDHPTPPHASEAVVEAQLRANDIAFAAPAATLGLPRGGVRDGTLLVDASTKGRDVGAMVAALSGTARLGVKDGAVPLFGLDDDRLGGEGQGEHCPEDGLAATPVTSASLGLDFSGELATVELGSVVTPSYSADLAAGSG